MAALAFHPLAELLPPNTNEHLSMLGEQILRDGLTDPIILLDNKILDGRARYIACERVGLAPRFETFAGPDPLAFVVARNLARHNLSDSVRALIAASLLTLSHGGNRHTHRNDKELRIIPDVAALFGLSKETVTYARAILERGTKDEIAAVRAGNATVTSLGRAMRAGADAGARKTLIGGTTATRGRNAERYLNQKMTAKIWGDVRDALLHLTSLPLPSEVATIARTYDRTGLVAHRLDKSIKWLEDFAHAWKRHQEQQDQARNHPADAREGGEPAGAQHGQPPAEPAAR